MTMPDDYPNLASSTVQRRHAGLWPRLGRILCRRGAALPRDIQAALAEQARAGGRVGDMLVERAGVARAAVEDALSDQRRIIDWLDRVLCHVPRLGDVMLESGQIDPERLKRALAIHQDTGRRLGEVLIEQGFVSRRDLVFALVRQQRLRAVTVASFVGMAVLSENELASASTSNPDSSSQSVMVSLTVPRRADLVMPETFGSSFDLMGEVARNLVPTAALIAPFEGPARVSAEGSGPGGRFILTGRNGDKVPFTLHLVDPITGDTLYLGDGEGGVHKALTPPLPAIMAIRFRDSDLDAGRGRACSGLLRITVNPNA